MRGLLVVSIIVWSLRSGAQTLPVIDYERAYDLPDSAIKFGVREYFRIILAYHPVVKQANLQPEKADQILRSARGNFDPELEINWDTKYFEGSSYYNILNAGLKVPVWFPVDIKTGIDRNTGQFLNPEQSIPDANGNRQLFLGFSVPVGKGLFIDERRATIKQAIAYQALAAAEQTNLINKIFYQATRDYYNWYKDYYQLQFLVQSIQIASVIFDRVKTDFQFGEAAAIDTIQAQITLQNRKIEYSQANIEYTNSSLKLSNHLWSADEKPLELRSNLVPPRLDTQLEPPSQQVYARLIEMARQDHPEIRKLEARIQQLNVKQQLDRENLKPQIDLNYTFLDEPVNSMGESAALDLNNNYKLGLSFSIPIFLRKERGKLKETSLQIRESQYEIKVAARNIINQINAIYFELGQLDLIIDQMSSAVSNYQLMVQAELFNLQNGESDLFKINFQQEKLIEAQLKYLKLRTYYEKVTAELYYTSGMSIIDIYNL